uniref:G protein-coupled receptor 184 n=1 Tax=Lepisosteus oculatus TaxID=7918 RepID=W5NMH4_LEPOC
HIMNTTDNRTCPITFGPISNVLMSIYIVVFVIGVLANLLTLGPIIQQVRSHNVLGVYLLNLSISDLLYIFTMPLWIYYYHMDHKWGLGHFACHLAGFLYYSNMYVSIYLLCCISIDRCLAVTYPLRAKAFRRSRYAWLVCLSVAVCVMGLHLIMILVNHKEDGQNKRCYESYPLTTAIARFNFLRVAFGFLAPLVILIFCYTRIFHKVRRSSVEDRGKRKVKLLSIGVIVIFSFCFAPYHILLFLRTLVFSLYKEGSCTFENHVHIYFTTSLAMSSLNSVVDPVLYMLVSNGILEDMRHFCWQKVPLGRKSITSPPLSPTNMTSFT